MRAALFACSVVQLLTSQTTFAATFQGLGDLPGSGFESRASAVSADGSVVVGTSRSDVATDENDEAFRWTRTGGMVGLGLLSSTEESRAGDVTADGTFVIGASDDQPFGWTQSPGIAPLFPLANLMWGIPRGVSADGTVIVGEFVLEGPQEAARWTAATGFQQLGGPTPGLSLANAFDVSADGSVVVGDAGVSQSRALVWNEGSGVIQLPLLPGAIRSQAYGVSADGSTVVGIMEFGTGNDGLSSQPFRWNQADGMISLGNFGGEGRLDGEAYAANADGSIVVGMIRGGNASGETAFIWDTTNGLRRLQDVLVSQYGVDLTNWTLLAATDITPDGLTIVGTGVHPFTDEEAWIFTVPEPSSAALAMIGLLTCVALVSPRRPHP